MAFDEHPRDRKAETETALPAIQTTLTLDEQIEDVRQQVGGDPDAVVAAFDDELAALFTGAQHDPSARFGIFRRVRQQIRQHLRDANPIAVDDQAGRNIDLQIVLLLDEDRRGHFDRPRHGVTEVEPFAPQLDITPPQTRHIEQIVDETCHVKDLPLEDIALARAVGAQLHQVDGGQRGCQRVAQFVP